jgi:hypothetical protein
VRDYRREIQKSDVRSGRQRRLMVKFCGASGGFGLLQLLIFLWKFKCVQVEMMNISIVKIVVEALNFYLFFSFYKLFYKPILSYGGLLPRGGLRRSPKTPSGRAGPACMYGK